MYWYRRMVNHLYSIIYYIIINLKRFTDHVHEDRSVNRLNCTHKVLRIAKIITKLNIIKRYS